MSKTACNLLLNILLLLETSTVNAIRQRQSNRQYSVPNKLYSQTKGNKGLGMAESKPTYLKSSLPQV